MAGTTWTKFYWSDWLSDPAVRASSLPARGLWIDMLCIAAAHDPIGYVAVAGRGLDETAIAQLTGGKESEVASLLGELERNGVFSRDRHGRIYSRRMVRDAKKAAISKKQGKEGGNPDIRRGVVPKAQRVRPYRRSDNPAKTQRIFAKGGGKCHWCKTTLDWSESGLLPNTFHVDHVVAVCDGGTNDESNLVSACASCNHARARIGWINPSDTNPDTKPHIPEAIYQTPSELSNSVPIGPELERAGATPAQRAMALELIETVQSPEKPKPPKPSRRAPSAWAPSAATIQTLTAEGYQPGQLERELAILRDHEFKTARSDWDACFRNWVRRSAPQNLRVINEQPRYNNRTSEYVSKLQDIGAAMVADCE